MNIINLCLCCHKHVTYHFYDFFVLQSTAIILICIFINNPQNLKSVLERFENICFSCIGQNAVFILLCHVNAVQDEISLKTVHIYFWKRGLSTPPPPPPPLKYFFFFKFFLQIGCIKIQILLNLKINIWILLILLYYQKC